MSYHETRRNAFASGIARRTFLKLMASSLAGIAFSTTLGCSAHSDDRDISEEQPIVLADTSGVPQALTETLFAFDTVITLTAYCEESLMKQALDRCRYFENHFSRTLEGSDIWRINNGSGAAIEVAPETAEIIQLGIEFGELTGGLFDITIGAISSLWDFKEGIIPDDNDLRSALSHIDYRAISVDGNRVLLEDPQAMIDLGGIAKGYIADDLARLFRDGGCESAIINLGGNALVVGTKPDGSNWKVGIQDPNAPTDAGIIASLDCSDMSVVTSGLYERYFEYDGKRYHHILDPFTGYPVQTDLLSASVASKASITGDVYATWMFLLGHDAALEFIETQEDIEAIVMDMNENISMTSRADFALRG